MPVNYRIDPAQKLVYTTFDGEVTDQQILRHSGEIQSDPEIDDSFVELIHANTRTMKGVTASSMRAIADALRNFTTIRRIAIVTSSLA